MWVLSKEAAKKTSKDRDYELEFYFDKNASKTCIDPKFDFEMWIQFGIGSLRGTFLHDQAILGDPKDIYNRLIIPKLYFGYTKEASIFRGDFWALIGMAYPELSAPKGHAVPPFFDSLMSMNYMKDNIFCFYFTMNPQAQEVD